MPTFKSEADNAGGYPSRRFGQRERKLLETVQEAYPFGAVFAGDFLSSSGSTTQTRTVTGVLSTDSVMAIIKTQGAVPVLVASAACTANTITFKMTADPGADHVIQYIVFRAQA
jgi:hypothetical protein